MLNRKLTLIALLALTAPLLAGDSQERKLKDNDLKKFAARLSDYIEAKQGNKGLVKAEEAIGAELEKLKKKLKGADPLSSSTDLGQALWLSHEYAKARTKKGKVTDETFDSSFIGDDGLSYAIWTPKGYSPKSTAYPLIITIPENDPEISPSQHIMRNWMESEVRDNAIIVAPTMPEAADAWETSGSPGDAGGVAFVLTTLKAVKERYAIDPNRVYISGRGAGTGAALKIASYFPHLFAGMIGRAGDASEVAFENMGNLPTYFTGAGSRATAYLEQVKGAGYDNCTIEMEGKELDIWAWIQEHPRIASPDKVILVPGAPFPVRGYWLSVRQSTETAARLEARVDRETNTIHIDAEGISDVSLYLNDTLVNLDEPVTVICNGAETVETIPRSLKLTLNLIFNAVSDSGQVFVAVQAYSIPETTKGD
ncbi:MAG: hypothetical protein ACI8QZ_002887 [Chlamydiales bacterium]|jgi:hypothetical protein